MERKRDYTPEFRAEAVKRVLAQGLSLAEAAVGAAGDVGELGGQCQGINGSCCPRSADGGGIGGGAEAIARGLGRGAQGARPLKKSDGVLCEGVAARYAFMKPWRLEYPVEVRSRVLDVSRSGC
jgi:hypothetical protein